MAVADCVRTTLGPKGLDKLLIDPMLNKQTTNDGVTILLSLKTIHPVARMIVEIAERQQELVGDGTTTAVIMAAEMIKEGRRLVKDLKVHPTKVVEGIDRGVQRLLKALVESSRKISINDPEFEQVVKTSTASKMDGAMLADLAIQAVRLVGEKARGSEKYDIRKHTVLINKLGVKDQMVNALVLERRRLDTGMPTEVKEAKILVLKTDLKPFKESWEKGVSHYQELLKMQEDRGQKMTQIADAIAKCGANVAFLVSSQIDEALLVELTVRKILAIRLATEEVDYITRYTGAQTVRKLEELDSHPKLGSAGRVYEDEKDGFIFIEDGAKGNIATIIVGGQMKETLGERWRTVTDGVAAAEAALNEGVVPGGGAAELHLIEHLKPLKLKGLEQVGLGVVSSALECVMRQILTNAGFNGLEKVMEAKAAPEGYGIDIDTGEVIDMWERGIIDPLKVKTTAIQAAAEIAKSVLRIDRNLAAMNLSEEAVSKAER